MIFKELQDLVKIAMKDGISPDSEVLIILDGGETIDLNGNFTVSFIRPEHKAPNICSINLDNFQ